MQITITEQKVSITMDTELGEVIESEANKVGMTVEEYLATSTMEKIEELFLG